MLYSFGHGKRYYYYENEFAHTLTDGTSYAFSTHSDNNKRHLNHNIRLGINYHLAKNHQLSFAYTSQLNNTRGTSEDDGDFTSLLRIHAKSQFHNFRLDYSTPFGFSAGAEYTYYNSPDEQWLKSSLYDEIYDITSQQRIDKWHAYLKQEHDLGKDWGLNYGINYTTSRDKSSQENNNKSSDGNTIQNEDQMNFYIGASKSFGQKLTMEASLMEEYYHTPIWNEWNLFPTLSITYLPKAGHVIQFDLDCDRDYPTYWSVKNFTTYNAGGYGKIVGNPTLKPSRELSLSLTYILHSRYVASLFFNNSKDEFRQLPYQSDTKKEMEYKHVNFDHVNQVGLMLTAPINIGNWWQNRLTFTGVYQNDKNSHFYDLPFDRSKWFCQALWNGTFLFGKHVLLNLDASVHTDAIQGIIDIPASGYLNAALTWKPLKDDKLQLKAYCNDIFETGDNHLHDTYRGQHVINKMYFGRIIGLSLTYRFGGYKAKQHEEVDTSRFGK